MAIHLTHCNAVHVGCSRVVSVENEITISMLIAPRWPICNDLRVGEASSETVSSRCALGLLRDEAVTGKAFTRIRRSFLVEGLYTVCMHKRTSTATRLNPRLQSWEHLPDLGICGDLYNIKDILNGSFSIYGGFQLDMRLI